MTVNRTTNNEQAAWGGFALPMLVSIAVLIGACGGEAADEPEPGVTSASSSVAETTQPEGSTTTPGSVSTLGDVTSPAPRFFTIATPTGTYSLSVGDSSTVQLPTDVSEPTAVGSSVLLIGMANVADSGNRQWELRAVEAGETIITVQVAEGSLIWTLTVEP